MSSSRWVSKVACALSLALLLSSGSLPVTYAAGDGHQLLNNSLPLPELNYTGNKVATTQGQTDKQSTDKDLPPRAIFIPMNHHDAEQAEAPTVETKPASTAAAPAVETKPEPTAAAPAVETKSEPTAAAPAVETEPEANAPAAATPAEPVGLAALPGTTTTAQPTDLSVPIIIDNDEEMEQEVTIEFQPLPTDESGAKVVAGARFPIVITSQVTSKTAKDGDPVHGRLKYELKVGDRHVANKGSEVRGHINYVMRARTILGSMLSTHRFYMTSGCIGIAFDEIVNEKGEHIPLRAEPARQARYVKNKAEGRELGINHKGQIAGPFSTQIKYKAIRVGLNFALAPTGVFSFGAMPVALGVIGAANPSFAFGKPIGTNVRHRRVKGFFWGALSGVPGSWLIEDTTVKGQEAIIKPGDEFLAEMREEFTGEPANDAEMMAGADTRVHGEVVKIDGKKPKRKS